MVSTVVSRMRLSLNPNRADAQQRMCGAAVKMGTRRREVCPVENKRFRFFNGLHAKLMTRTVLSLAFSFLLCGCTQNSPTQTAGGTTSDITGTSAPVNTDKSVALTAPAIQPDPKQLTQLGAAMHKYRDAHSQFPTASSNAAGQSGLSWRVHILPFLGQETLYDQFNLDEAWDSPQNLELAAQMPEVFRVSGVEPNKTVYHVFVGEGTPFGQEEGVNYGTIRDGADNTIMVVAGNASTAVEWTRPGGIDFDPTDPFRSVARVDEGYPMVSMAGFTWLIPDQSTEKLAAFVTHDGSESTGTYKAWGR